MSAPDFGALGLLEGLDDDARAARLRLLRELHEDGCTVEELRAAVDEGRLALLPAERALGGAGTLTPRQVAERAGVELAAFEAVRRACGLPLPQPDEPVLGGLDMAEAEALARFMESGLPLDGLIEASRVFGEAAASAAAAAGTLANASLPRPGDTEHSFALRLGAASRDLVPAAAQLLGILYVLHMREQLRQEMVAQEEIATGRRSDVLEVSVGFCDLVGFTQLGEGVPAADLGRIATRLATLAADAARPPVRLVKTLGDAVMLVAPAPAPLLDAALELMDAAAREGEGFPAIHAGAAHGQALRRWGDFYGATVNRAARLAERARPAALLTDAAVREGAGDGAFRWSPAGAKRLKGLPEPVPTFRCRRAATDA